MITAPIPFHWSPALGLQRYALWGHEFMEVEAGFVMTCPLPVFRCDGLLRLDGVLRVGVSEPCLTYE